MFFSFFVRRLTTFNVPTSHVSIFGVYFIFLPYPGSVMVMRCARQFSSRPFIYSVIFTVATRFGGFITIRQRVSIYNPARVVILRISKIRYSFGALIANFACIIRGKFMAIRMEGYATRRRITYISRVRIGIAKGASIRRARISAYVSHT